MIEISKLFDVPRGVIDVRFDDREYVEQLETSVDEEPSTVETPTTDAPSIPTDFDIVSQRLRTLPDGSSVVDVVINFPGSDDNLEFDVRILQQ